MMLRPRVRGRWAGAIALLITVMALGRGSAAALEVVPPPMAPDAVDEVGADVLGGDEGERHGFGTVDLDICTIGFPEFLPFSSLDTYTTATATTGERWMTGGGPYLVAGVDCVPNGAELRELRFYVRDDSGGDDFEGRLIVYYRASGLGNTKGGETIDSCTTSGTPGDTICSFNLNHTVMRRGLWDVDGIIDVANYQLWAKVPNSDIAIAMVRLLWRRQVSPAPATATFNDVPTGHLFFQHIEALVDSGITVGCGGGNYCPDDPLTRGQMAVFLSKALGLHFPSGLSF